MIPGRPKRPRPRRRPTPPPTPFSRYISPSLPGKKPDLLPSWRCSVDRSIGPALQVTIYKRDWAINTAVIAARQRRSEMDFMLRRCLGTTSPGGRASRQEGVGEGRGGEGGKSGSVKCPKQINSAGQKPRMLFGLSDLIRTLRSGGSRRQPAAPAGQRGNE